MLTLQENTMLGEIPNGWKSKSLAEVLTEHYPGDWGKEHGLHMVNVLRSTNLTGEGGLDVTDVAIRGLSPRKANMLTPKQGDILLERSGGGPNQPVGRVGLVKDDMPGYALSNFLHLLRPDGDKVNPRFLGWVLYRINQTGRIVRLEQQTTQMRNLNFRDYITMPIPYPSLKEQAAIARILDAVDTAIEHARIATKRARQLDHCLLHELLERGLGSANCSRRRFPQHWRMTRVDEVATVGSGVTLGKDTSGHKSVELPYLRVANVQDGYLDLDTIKTIRVPVDDVQKYRLEAGDVLMTEGGDIDKLGRGTIWDGQIPDCLHQNHIFRIRANREVLEPSFYAIVVESDIAKRYFSRVAKRTTNLASTNKTQVRAFRFPIPPTLSEQRQIVEIVARSKSLLAGLSQKETALCELKKSLMHDLLTGKVRVHDASKAGTS
ncbi:MAG: restriction endonuclease subunit S [Gemmatimonadota bacterium]|nr:restriction endonuclease subunit S [Gemmatimonadota bacterium]